MGWPRDSHLNLTVPSATLTTARSKTSWLAAEGFVDPLSLRTNWSAEAWISSSVAGGSKLTAPLAGGDSGARLTVVDRMFLRA